MNNSPFSLSNLENNQDFNFLEQLSKSDLFEVSNDINNDSPYCNIDLHCKYHDEMQYVSSYANTNAVTYMSLNIQSLQSKFSQFQEMIQNLNNNNCAPDIIMLQEVWKLPDPSLFDITGYNFITKLRSTTQGGGVGIYIKSMYRFNILHTSSTFIDRIFESLFIEVWLSNSNKIIIGNVYRPPANHPVFSPHEQFNQFIELFSNTLENITNSNAKILIGGDFNLDALKYRISSQVTEYIDLLFSYGLLQLIMKPTRCTEFSASLIDHFISNSRDDLHTTVIVTTNISDHFPIIYISKQTKQKSQLNLISYRDFSHPNFQNFTSALGSINWDVMSNYQDAQYSYDYFSDTFLTLFNLYFPILHKKPNKNNNPMNPWMSKGLLISRRHKTFLNTKYLKNRTETNKLAYTNYRNLYDKVIKQAKKTIVSK